MNSTLARVVFETGAKLRNPTLFDQYDYLKSTEWLSRQKLEEIQLENASKFLTFAGKYSPYYKECFNKVGFKPSGMSDVAELKALPEINKATLIRENSAIHATSLAEKLSLAETSGTSGEALAFYRNERWDSMNRAALMRSYDWYGVKPWDQNGYLWGYNIGRSQARKIRILDAIQNRFRLFRYSEAEIKHFCRKLSNANFLSGYSSMVYEVAKRINELNLGPLPLKLVKGTSEMILDAYHTESVEAFGRKITSEYGAAESGLIAFECPEGGIHINIENIILEENSDGDLLVTNLVSHSFPIIRYRLGDMVTLARGECTCGRKHPLIQSIVGRKGANVIGLEGTYPALTFYYVFKNLALESNILLNYKAVQDFKGKVDIFIEGEANYQFEKDINHQLKKYFRDDVFFRIIYLEQLPIEMKKRQYFESNI